MLWMSLLVVPALVSGTGCLDVVEESASGDVPFISMTGVAPLSRPGAIANRGLRSDSYAISWNGTTRMRGLKSTIALIVILVGLVVHLLRRSEEASRPTRAGDKAKVFTVDADQIEEIQLGPATGEACASKANGAWQLSRARENGGRPGAGVECGDQSRHARDQQRRRRRTPSTSTPVRVEPPRRSTSPSASRDRRTQRHSAARREDATGERPLREDARIRSVSSWLRRTSRTRSIARRSTCADKAALKFDQSKVGWHRARARAETRPRWRRAAATGAVTKPSQGEGRLRRRGSRRSPRCSSLQMQKIVSDAVSSDAKDLANYGLDKPDADRRP